MFTSQEGWAAFSHIKDLLSQSSQLVIMNEEDPLILHTDASTKGGVLLAQRAAVAAFASMTSGALNVRRVAAAAFASITSYDPDARIVAAAASANTGNDASNAPSVRTSSAPWKGAHSLAIASAAQKGCCTTCAPDTVARTRRSPKSKS